jgi:hypothetical protein
MTSLFRPLLDHHDRGISPHDTVVPMSGLLSNCMLPFISTHSLRVTRFSLLLSRSREVASATVVDDDPFADELENGHIDGCLSVERVEDCLGLQI